MLIVLTMYDEVISIILTIFSLNCFAEKLDCIIVVGLAIFPVRPFQESELIVIAVG